MFHHRSFDLPFVFHRYLLDELAVPGQLYSMAGQFGEGAWVCANGSISVSPDG
jgi:hypothetical protein